MATRRQLWEQVCETAGLLRSLGIKKTDRVAVVMPGGPELAVLFLAVASTAACAPLNPAYRRADFDFYLDDLKPSALILPAHSDSAAFEAACSRHIPVIQVETDTSVAGRFYRLSVSGSRDGLQVDWAGPDDIALVLHTSGTTSRPKMVPLSHRNVCTSAANVADTLRLSTTDRCLNVMPLFHIHGLIGGLLSSLSAGAGVICTPGFEAGRFLQWAHLFGASWYTAVPTMHQALLEQAERDPRSVEKVNFRLIRSSSSPLPPVVLQRLEDTFSAPVVEAYGMTEAAHQMASNPLPPGKRKPGSVGLPAGPDVAIMDQAGSFVPAGIRGEVVIRGENVTRGYEANPQANAGAFSNGWFRTGDEGYFDEDGYLYLTGRLKELINRGGEKITPREIDEVLLQHEAVAQAVAFAVPHETLGEDLAAAVVLRPGFQVTEQDLRRHVSRHLADFKVPGRILRVDAIPRGATGKLQRIGLYDKLRDQFETTYQAPQTEEETWVTEAFAEVLGQERVGREDNFFALGGDSLRAVRIVSRLRVHLGFDVPVVALFEYSTPALLADELVRLRDSEAKIDVLVGDNQ